MAVPRKRTIASLLVAVLMLSAACSAVMAQATSEVAAGGPPAGVPVAPGAPPHGPAAQPARRAGFYINPIWLAVVMAMSAFWLYLMSWVCDDARGSGMDFPMYTTLMLGAGGAGLLLALLVHPAFAVLMLVCIGAAFAVYVVRRNRVVPERFKFLGPYHRAALLARMPIVNKVVTLTPKLQPPKPSLTLTTDEGMSLRDVVAATPTLSKGASALTDIILRAGATRTRKVRLQPAGDQYVGQYLLDGVLHNLETIEADLGLQVLGCASQLAGLSKDGRMRQGTGRFHSELPGLGAVTIEAQISAAGGKPALLLTLPEWERELHRAGLDALGMHEAIVKRVRTALDQRRGALVVCGPPGCGKTTTLYALTGALDVFTTDIALIEKRPEHDVEHVRRWTIGADKPFAQVFQEALREVPDAIVMGELEKPEESQSLLRFAASDGLVLTALKAPDGPEALLQLASSAGGAEPVQRAVTCVLAQRLVRKLCPNCHELVEPNPTLLKKLNVDPASPGVWYRPVGCEACLNSGYHGRTGIFGMLILTDPVKSALPGGQAQAIRQAAGPTAFRTMYQDGIGKVTAGVTTLDEVRRVLKAQ